MVRLDDLTRNFGRVSALANVTLGIPEGSVFALLGPNGAGKSTALKICMNLLRPSSGSASISGIDSRRLGPRELARIAWVSEHRSPPAAMTAESWFAYLADFYPHWRPADLALLVREQGLPVQRKLGSLSRGQRMQAALCAALAYRPRLLLLDEPFSGLDVLVRDRLMETLAARSGEMTVVLATHDLAEIESFATHVAYLAEGRLRFVEEAEALATRFREIEITLDTPSQSLPGSLPASWLHPCQSGPTVRFVDSRYDEARTGAGVRERFAGVRQVDVRPMPLRSIFVALAKRGAV